MATWNQFKNGIYNWVSGNTSVNLVRWARQNDPHRPDLPYIDLWLRQLSPIGDDYISAPNQGDASATVRGDRDNILEVNYYGPDAQSHLDNLYMSTFTFDVRQQMRADEIIFVRSENIIDITELLDTRFEERALATFIMRYSSEFTDDNAGVIESVEDMEIEYIKPDNTSFSQIFNIPE